MRFLFLAVLIELGFQKGVDRAVQIEGKPWRLINPEPSIEIKTFRTLHEEFELGTTKLEWVC